LGQSVILGHLVHLGTISNFLGLSETILNQFGTFLFVFGHFRQIWVMYYFVTITNHTGPFLTISDHF
jgi:hypothetical protein